MYLFNQVNRNREWTSSSTMNVTTDAAAMNSHRHADIWSSGRNGWLEGETMEAIFQNILRTELTFNKVFIYVTKSKKTFEEKNNCIQ